MTPQSKVEVRALKRVRTSTSPYILYVASLQRVYSNRSLFLFIIAVVQNSTVGADTIRPRYIQNTSGAIPSAATPLPA